MKSFRLLVSALMLLGGGNLFGGDYDTLFQTLKANWPDRKGAVVACNLELSRFAITDLLEAAKKVGISVQAINIKTEKDVDNARGIVGKMRPDLIILVDSDPILGVQGRETKGFISSGMNSGIPSVGTNPEFLKIGGVLAVGPKTDGKVFSNGRSIRALRLKVPEGSIVQ